jgi:HEAT repeat protein
MNIIAIFRESIDAAIPDVVNILKTSDNLDVRRKCADTLSKLSEKGKHIIFSSQTLSIKIVDECRFLIAPAIPEIVDLLEESHSDACQVHTYALAKLLEQGKPVQFIGSTLLTIIIAEFRPLIAPAVPKIVNLLKDGDREIHIACADALSTLSERGKPVNLLGVILLMMITAEFRPLIEPVIPVIVNLLQDNDRLVRRACTNALSKLSGQGETAIVGSSFAHENHSRISIFNQHHHSCGC